MEDADRQSIIDAEHLRLLALGYRISAGVAAFYGLFGLLYIAMGVVFGIALSQAPSQTSGPPVMFFVWYFASIGVAFLVVGFTIAGLRWTAARRLTQRRGRAFCQVVAALSCLEIPYGLALGVFTFIALGRDSVRDSFS
jgi:hypothetical protein